MTNLLKIIIVCLGVALMVTVVYKSVPLSTSTPPLITDTPILAPSISTYPETILPGDPVIITITSSSTPTELTLFGKQIPLFIYGGSYRGIAAISFEEKKSLLEARVKFSDGSSIEKDIFITPRKKIERPLGIPEKLGGNTPEAGKTLVNNLASENASLNSVPTATTTLWSSAFVQPLVNLIITDDYGYNRETVNYTIPHKGTDFRASIGTEVLAMNSGTVKLSRKYTVYGNTIVVDHGLGVHTLYMHLSELKVKEGDKVSAGQVIGLSGNTGYADAAHLHISIKIGGVSIDPMTFLGFFGVR